MHLFYFREAWRSFKHHRGLGYTAIFSITAALALTGLFVLLAHNARVALELVVDRREMVVYLNDGLTPPQRDALIGRLQQLYGNVTYVSKEQAWKEFSEQVGDPGLLEAVDVNPLPASLRIKLRPELLNYAAMETAARQVSQFPEVEDVRYGGDWVRRLDQIKNGLVHAAIMVGAVVALAVVFVLYNTIRLTVLARRPQVEIMSRLGATDRFIAAPYVIEAMLEALIAGLIALALVFVFQLFLGAVVMLGWLAALLALTRVLRSVGA
ncbi:MAG: ABC transporter permease [Candidatus Eisenbacteria bacterium]|uniref:Cell division protein FtsX n=1 Tax=Eiseniibacteriota bacterium TaxID=2212470 RepID=A0A538TZH5_UNCEI|nr:MAG: ABC transporter permease [Candidatus Eisenbacteria bacterium]